jgi:hypothetical protein
MQNDSASQANFFALVDAIINASLGGHPVAKEQIGQLGSTPALLIKLGAPDLPLGIKGKTIEKIVMDHGIPKSMVKRLAGIIETPKAIYRSATQTHTGAVVLTFEITGLGAVIVTVAYGQSVGRSHIMNLITSMYAKEDNKVFARWDSAALKLWSAK